MKHIDYPVVPKPHTPMYLMHKYWARKPHNVVREYIENYSKKGEIILDPFIGSGQTAIAAIKANRHFIGYEVEKEYVELAERRITEFKRTFKAPKLTDFIE